MQVLIAIALKSLLVAGATLGLLQLLKHRSASERSWVAHIGLLALVLLALAPLVLPSWNVETPGLFAETNPPPAAGPAPEASPLPSGAVAAAAPVTAPVAQPTAPRISLSAFDIATAAYAVPAAILLVITLLALMRLIALRARADVLVDGHWLSALARAQRRMGFKHGTALLTSDELASPISWGLMRPVILLNSRAVEAAGEAEAIIAHELAHVARLDWVKLLLARVATALFWFNPLVWMLAREAHQLREEAADDAVLGADIADTDYAELLVGVARHDCPGLLLGAHGVAPSKSSLARRVARVLDAGSPRAPAARPFALGVFVGAVVVAAPLAALTLTPAVSPAEKAATATPAGKKAAAIAPYYPETPSDIPHIIADGVSTSVATAVAAVAPLTEDEADAREAALERAADAREAARDAALEARENAREAAAEIRTAVRESRRRSAVDRAIEMKAVGVTPEYVSGMIAAAPHFARIDASDFVGMKAVGVTPDFARSWVKAGFRGISPDQLTEARAVGLDGSYVRQLSDAGVRAHFDDYVQLRAVGVTPEYVRSLRKAGYVFRNADELVEMRAVGVGAHDLRAVRPMPPRPPKVPPRNWDPTVDPDPDPDDG
jgi:beta-lactamase regulating signal transducer with metallopeptidase domain